MKRSLRQIIRAEDGFGTLEVLMAVLLLGLGILAMVGAFDSSRRLATVAERKEVASHLGEEEIERLLSQGYPALATADPGAAASDPTQPTYYIRSSCANSTGSGCYQWRQSGASEPNSTEPLVIDSAAQSAGPVAWSAAGLSGNFYRFITWVDDPCAACSAADQANTRDYKRITVAITLNGSPAPRRPIVISTIATDPAG